MRYPLLAFTLSIQIANSQIIHDSHRLWYTFHAILAKLNPLDLFHKIHFALNKAHNSQPWHNCITHWHCCQCTRSTLYKKHNSHIGIIINASISQLPIASSKLATSLYNSLKVSQSFCFILLHLDHFMLSWRMYVLYDCP